ncbi:hypothetical protein EHF44_15055 [Cupriavidus pauculus]|uniref:Uncharacterized protein n=1 Tax=Cupriavidus pauculus TaxID=82633 RepID=A0A3G8H2Y9_9BURK|nr:hypothetical protein EHF44_15055 [Cupriavidus pauculus]
MHSAELSRLLANLIRLGSVVEVRHARPPRVRVRSGTPASIANSLRTPAAAVTTTTPPPARPSQKTTS